MTDRTIEEPACKLQATWRRADGDGLTIATGEGDTFADAFVAMLEELRSGAEEYLVPLKQIERALDDTVTETVRRNILTALGMSEAVDDSGAPPPGD